MYEIGTALQNTESLKDTCMSEKKPFLEKWLKAELRWTSNLSKQE